MTAFLFRFSAKWLQRRPGQLIFPESLKRRLCRYLLCARKAITGIPIYYEDTGDRKVDDYNVTLKMTQIVEEVIKEYPDNWLWFQHRWNTPYTPPEEKELKQGEK